MHTYNQSNGIISGNGQFLGYGYSGHGDGVNNPALQNVPNVGPIPVGLWDIGDPIDDPRLGSFALPLSPAPGTNTYGRSGFFIHGDEIDKVGEDIASHGCIVVSRDIREAIAADPDRQLQVI